MLNQALEAAGARRGGARIKDISGQRFGHLTALYPSEERARGSVKWVCRCDCGKIVTRTYVSLRKGGENTSCGCLKNQIAVANLSAPKREKPVSTEKKPPRVYQIADLTGRRFGRLEAIRPTDMRDKTAVMWECRCDCGNTVYRSHRMLKIGGDNASCGCLIPEIRKQGFHLPDKTVGGTNIALLESTGLRADNKSGVRGVFYLAQRNKWRAELRFKGKNYYIGNFDMKEDAVNARARAEENVHRPAVEAYYARGGGSAVGGDTVTLL